MNHSSFTIQNPFRFLLSLLAVCMLCLSACSSATEADPSNASGTQDEAGSAASVPSGSKIVVVYFSATGNTGQAAQYISDLTGARLYELKPDDPYTAEDLDWDNPDSRIMQEYNDPSKRNVPLSNEKIPDWDSYSVVFLGYPIWWDDAAWPIDGFVRNTDFAGKTVYPFCTSTSSSIDQSEKTLKSMTKTGTWETGQRFPENVSEDEVRDWLASIHVLKEN